MDFLIVDDDPLICEGIVRRMREMVDLVALGSLHCRDSAEAALAFLKQDRVDILITDVRMYAMDGLALIEAAKALHSDLGCIVVTGYHEMDYAQRAIRLSVHDFLLKPYSMQTMRETIGRVVNRLEAERAEKHKHRDMALLMALRRGGQADQVFEELNLPCGDEPLYLALWREKGKAVSALPLWHYQLASEPYMFVRCPQAQYRVMLRSLDELARDWQCSLGLSLPGQELSALLLQAEAACSLSWCWREPCVIPYTQRKLSPAEEEMIQKLIQPLRSLQVRKARQQLSLILSGSLLPEFASGLYSAICKALEHICKEYDVAQPDLSRPPAPFTGYARALEQALTLAETSIEQIADQAVRKPVAWAKRYVREHPTENIDMAELAKRLHMSYSYFSKLFKEQAGLTFTDYVLDLRMSEAKRLLMQGMQVTDVAQRVGYTNIFNFSRAFTRIYGIAPDKWRRSAVADRESQ